MSMATYRYLIEHVTGDDNVWGDLLSRWGSSTISTQQREARVRALAIAKRVSSLQEQDFEWPSMAELKRKQDKTRERGERLDWQWSGDQQCYVNDQG